MHQTPLRRQWFIMFLQKYNFVVNYIPGKDLLCSESLSGAPLKEQSLEISETEVNCQVHSVISSFSINTERLKQSHVETLNDMTMQRVASCITKGRSKLQKKINSELKPYYNLRDDLTEGNTISSSNAVKYS